MNNPEFRHLPRIRVGDSFARRDESGTLVETGFIDVNGDEYRDTEPISGRDRIDGSNPAATVPWNQEWA